MTVNPYYVAGLFDGEGYIYIFKKVRRQHIGYYLSVGVTMCHRPTVEMFHQSFGGHLNHNRADLRSSANRCQFMWGANNQLAATFLRYIEPYLIIKKAEAKVGIALQDHIDQNLYNFKGRGDGKKRLNREAILAHREKLFQQCKDLKTICYPPLDV